MRVGAGGTEAAARRYKRVNRNPETRAVTRDEIEALVVRERPGWRVVDVNDEGGPAFEACPMPPMPRSRGTRFRLRPGWGWFEHLWKAATRQDHGKWRGPVRAVLPRDGVAIDAGAHGGQFTRLLAGIAPRGSVVAVEPSGYARSVLRPALWARGTRNVVVVAAALGAEPGAAVLRTPVKRGGRMGFGAANLAGGGWGTRPEVAEPVAVLTLDALVDALGLPRLDFIKADIEGHEASLVAGGRRVLARHRPALLLEMDGERLRRAGGSLPGLWGELAGLGYRPNRLDGDGALVPWEGAPADGDVLWVHDKR